jgi:hypothetical protein
MCEKPVAICRQMSIVKASQPLIDFNYISDKSKSRILHIRLGCDFVCDFVDHFNSVFSVHTLVLVTFYVVVLIYDSYYGVAGIMVVNKGPFGSGMWMTVTYIETVFNAVGFTVLIYVSSGTTCEVSLSNGRVPIIRLKRDKKTVSRKRRIVQKTKKVEGQYEPNM